MLQQNAKLLERAMAREREREKKRTPDALCMEYVLYQKLPTYVTSQKYSKCS
jgi:hypothetical protein